MPKALGRKTVRVVLNIDLDADWWVDHTNGDASGRPATTAWVANDVRSYVLNMIQCAGLLDEADAKTALGR